MSPQWFSVREVTSAVKKEEGIFPSSINPKTVEQLPLTLLAHFNIISGIVFRDLLSSSAFPYFLAEA